MESKLKIKPSHGNIVVKILTPKENNEGGLIISTNKKDVHEAEVLAVHDGLDLKSKIGDKVIFITTGTKIDLDGEEYVIIKESDVLAVILESK